MITQKQILDHFGLDDKDAEELDPYVDWEALGRSIEEPTKMAVCNIIDKRGKIVICEGKPARVHVEVNIKNYQEKLNKQSLRFVEWD